MSQPAVAKLPVAPDRDPTMEPETSFSADEAPQPPKRRSIARKLVLGVVLLGALLWIAHTVMRLFTFAETDDAYLTSHIHQVNAHVGGTITEALVDQNVEVKAGDVLFRLDPRDHEAKVQQAEAQLAQSDALVAYTGSQIADARAKVDLAQAMLTKAEADFARTQDLAKTRVVSGQDLDAAKATLDSGRASLVAAQASAHGMESGLDVAKAQRKNSESALENARLQLSYNTITAPVSGRTSRRGAEVGAYAQPGQTLIAIVEPEIWIEANFKETQLAKMRIGQEVEVAIDALPGREFRGKVESFSPASGAQFAMLPPDNATGNFTKVVQRVPVRIRLDADSIRGYEDRLRAGLSAVVAVRLK